MKKFLIVFAVTALVIVFAVSCSNERESAAQATSAVSVKTHEKTPMGKDEVCEYLQGEEAWQLLRLFCGPSDNAREAPAYAIPYPVQWVYDDFTAEKRDHLWYCPVFDYNGKAVAMLSVSYTDGEKHCTVSPEFVTALNEFIEENGQIPIRIFRYNKVCYAMNDEGRYMCLNPDAYGQQGGDPRFDLSLTDEQIERLMEVTEASIVFDQAHEVILQNKT